MRAANLHAAKKIDSYLEITHSQDFWRALTRSNFLKFLRAIKHVTNFPLTNLLFLSVQILCACYFNSVRKYASPWISNISISEFFRLFYIASTQNNLCYSKTSYFEPLRDVESDFKFVQFFYTPCTIYEI